MISSIGCLILAAGESKRMGRPKQLIIWENKTLIEHTFQIASQAGFEDIKIVLGAFSEKILPIVKDFKADILVNPMWENGIGSSLCKGLERFENRLGIMILLIDQPLIRAEYLIEMAETFIARKPLAVASSYKGNPGPPAIFNNALISKILKIADNNGAQKILKRYLDQIILMPESTDLKDFDFPEDFD